MLEGGELEGRLTILCRLVSGCVAVSYCVTPVLMPECFDTAASYSDPCWFIKALQSDSCADAILCWRTHRVVERFVSGYRGVILCHHLTNEGDSNDTILDAHLTMSLMV